MARDEGERMIKARKPKGARLNTWETSLNGMACIEDQLSAAPIIAIVTSEPEGETLSLELPNLIQLTVRYEDVLELVEYARKRRPTNDAT